MAPSHVTNAYLLYLTALIAPVVFYVMRVILDTVEIFVMHVLLDIVFKLERFLSHVYPV